METSNLLHEMQAFSYLAGFLLEPFYRMSFQQQPLLFRADMVDHMSSHCTVQGRVSPTWESIDIKRQIFFMLCNTHSVTAYEVGSKVHSAAV